MPDTSTVKQFVAALQSGTSKTTRALDALFRSPARHKDQPYFAALQKPGALKRPLAAWARKLLQGEGLSAKELNHVSKWPDAQKETLRQLLVSAVNKGRRVRFFWALHGGAHEETDVPARLPKSGGVTVTFRSPQKNVKLSTATDTFGHINVGVGR